MWGQFLRTLAVVWCIISGSGTCIGLWADRDSLTDMNATIPAVVIWLIPNVALGLAIFMLGMLLTAGVIKWRERRQDLRNEGPQIRKFHSLTCRIKRFKTDLAEYYDRPGTHGWRIGQFNVLNAEASMLRTELQDLGIEIPIFDHSDNQEHVEYLISYLGGVEQLARRGNLQDARKIHLEPEWLYTGPKDGKIHDN